MALTVNIKNKSGKEDKYYLCGHGKLFYLKKARPNEPIPRNTLDQLPDGYEITKTPSGMPYVRRIK